MEPITSPEARVYLPLIPPAESGVKEIFALLCAVLWYMRVEIEERYIFRESICESKTMSQKVNYHGTTVLLPVLNILFNREH